MLIRVIFFLLCAAGFINSCNSLISLQIGTHKLRSFTMEEIKQNGIKDADYIEITDAVIPEQFVHAAIQKTGDKDIIIFPVFAHQTKNKPTEHIYVVGWQQKKDPSCIQSKNCLEPGVRSIKGVIRKIKKRRDRSGELTEMYHQPLAQYPIYMEVGQAPLAWYWHLLVLVLTAGAIVLIEMNRTQKNIK